jgi:hypothetical protein
MSLLKKAMLAVVTFVLALVAFVAPVRHTNVDAAQPATLYLKPNSNWTQGSARFAAYFFGIGETWVSMTDADKDGTYEVVVPTAKVYPNVIFCRMNPSATANNWNNKWNQTGDLTIPTNGKNLFTVPSGSWDGSTTTWSVFGSTEVEPEPEPEVPADGFTLYFENTLNWSTVNAYVWGASSNSWPGAKMTKVEGETNIYSYTGFKEGSNIIFNNGSKQTIDLTIPTDGRNLFVISSTQSGGKYTGEWSTYGDVEVTYGDLVLGVIGSFAPSNWGSDIDMVYNEEAARYELEMTFAVNDQWKVRKDNAWDVSYGFANANAEAKKYTKSSSDGNLQVTVAGKYLVYIDNDMNIGMEPVVEPWKLEVKVGFQVGTKDEAKALRLVAELNLDAEMLETFESAVAFRVTRNGVADERVVTTLYSSVNPMNGEAKLDDGYYAVLTYVNIPAGEYLVEVLVDGVVAATVTATVA